MLRQTQRRLCSRTRTALTLLSVALASATLSTSNTSATERVPVIRHAPENGVEVYVIHSLDQEPTTNNIPGVGNVPLRGEAKERRSVHNRTRMEERTVEIYTRAEADDRLNAVDANLRRELAAGFEANVASAKKEILDNIAGTVAASLGTEQLTALKAAVRQELAEELKASIREDLKNDAAFRDQLRDEILVELGRKP